MKFLNKLLTVILLLNLSCSQDEIKEAKDNLSGLDPNTVAYILAELAFPDVLGTIFGSWILEKDKENDGVFSRESLQISESEIKAITICKLAEEIVTSTYSANVLSS